MISLLDLWNTGIIALSVAIIILCVYMHNKKEHKP